MQKENPSQPVFDTDLSAHTPLMQQYPRIKDEHPHSLLHYRMVAFYELLDDADAAMAARLLEVTLTRRGQWAGIFVVIADVSFRAVESNL